nr:receptor-like protein 35 [Coffea arabica]
MEGVNCSKKSGHVIQLHLQNSAPIVDDLIDAEFFSEFEHGRDGGDPKSAFSEGISRLNNLISFNLGNNQFEGRLDGIWNWSSLASLDLSDDDFSTFLPSLLSTLTSLVSLVLSDNDFQGYIPGKIANISSLRYLDLSLTILAPLYQVNYSH